MRIALLTYSTKPRGGVVHTLALAEAMARAGHVVHVWSLGRGGDAAFFRPVDPAVELRLVPFPDVPGEDVGARILRSIAVLAAAFEDADYDVVHAQDCISANAVPDCVRTVHHLDTFTTPELAACHERAVVTPHTLVCVSSAVAAEVAAGWGRTASVIPNGVDAARFAVAAGPDGAAGRGRWRARLGRYVLAVGGIEPRKGTLDLVEAMAVVQRRRPDLELVVAGGETLFDYRDYRARVDARAAELAVHPVVLGPVDHEQLPTLVAGAEVFAFPSTKEGFGLAAMEALAAGVPVVTRDLPVLREVFGPAAAFASGPAGFAAALLAGSAGEDQQRVAAGRALAAAHDWDRAAAAHLDLYRTSVPHRRSTTGADGR
ncbi:MSMEG_0565 family glycosyltransferase [Klenkia taihuensis]|uniref:Glycosyltransferase, MSMEG_0565 family n=1 Tax=Klenkia taihuensis TaxID=1225127 RepID=A0A1I1REU6_9ACTN|nr:MSMEG_0565 family glycosyltransferase [Klenkia taihuensis]GHE07132.1 glycosyl transferase family 1 [Klenkia taihuensis]SFD30678.1 glycosyltransferase, MSMEG_0565 family [Klenkia taihuensis]